MQPPTPNYQRNTNTLPDIAQAIAITEQAGTTGYRQVRPTHATRKRNRMQERMLKALVEEKGIVTYAAEKIRLNRCTHYEWLANSPEYAQKYEALGLEDLVLDRAEKVVERQLELGDSNFSHERALALNAATFLLKTKGKKRGYAEKPDVAVQVNTQVNNQQGPIWDLKRILKQQAEKETQENTISVIQPATSDNDV